MLRMTPSTSAEGACRYFDESLSKGDYYVKRDEPVAHWHGRGAALLGLSGEVTQAQFHALTKNRNPLTGEKLTPRDNPKRRVGFDFTFSCPKSVSVIMEYGQDKRIESAFRDAVFETMREIESNMETRVRRAGQNHDRKTCNLIWADFLHKISRPIDGSADPHLHLHAFCMAPTWDPEENRWKSGQFGNLKRDAPFWQARYLSRLAAKMEALGYATERKGLGFELAGFSREIIDKFSRRTKEIEKEAEERGIKSEKFKAELGAKTRGKKKAAVMDTRKALIARLTPEEKHQLDKVIAGKAKGNTSPPSAANAIEYAIAHCFERQSVVCERDILTEATKYSVGSLLPEDIQSAWEARTDVLRREEDERVFATTREVIAEEMSMIKFCRDGINAYKPLVPRLNIDERKFDEEGRKALTALLSSKSRVTSLVGVAGAGKTFCTTEAVAQMKRAGRHVTMLAPTAEAARKVLRAEGHLEAETLAKFIHSPEMQNAARGGVIWVDESGLLSVKSTNALFEIAKKLDCRIVLSGDPRQHNSVDRGSAHQTLIDHAGLEVAKLSTIRRQRVDWYKETVAHLSEGRTLQGFGMLNQAGAVKEIQGMQDRHEAIAQDYVTSLSSGQDVLVVAPTHKEGESVTEAIRDRLKEQGKLSGKTRSFATAKSLGWTEAQRSDPRRYQEGQIVQFEQNAKGIKRGEKLTVVGERSGGKVMVKSASGSVKELPLNHASRFDVYRPKETELMIGDTIRITKNGVTPARARFDNGDVHRVAGFTSRGDIVLEGARKRVLPKDFLNFDHGYTFTSYKSQGKSVGDKKKVGRVIVAIGSESFGAASKKVFYVAASRARDEISVVTDNVEDLTDVIQRSGERRAAMDLIKPKKATREPTPRNNKALQHILRMQRISEASKQAFERPKEMQAEPKKGGPRLPIGRHEPRPAPKPRRPRGLGFEPGL